MKISIFLPLQGEIKYDNPVNINGFKDKHSIDNSDPFVIKYNGIYYLIYSTNNYVGCDEQRPGTVIMIDKLLDMFTLEGDPKLLVKPSLDQEMFESNRFDDGRDWHTIEGGFYLKKNDNSYLMYSGNAYTHYNYFVAYSKTYAKHNEISEFK